MMTIKKELNKIKLGERENWSGRGKVYKFVFS